MRPSTLVTLTSLTGTFPESMLAADLSQDVQFSILVIALVAVVGVSVRVQSPQMFKKVCGMRLFLAKALGF